MEPAELLQHPAVQEPIGPVLWITIFEATEQSEKKNAESLLMQGLTTPWITVRYAAAMALAQSSHIPLQPETRVILNDHLGDHEAFPVRLAAAYALIRSGDGNGHLLLLVDMLPCRQVRFDLSIKSLAEKQ